MATPNALRKHVKNSFPMVRASMTEDEGDIRKTALRRQSRRFQSRAFEDDITRLGGGGGLNMWENDVFERKSYGILENGPSRVLAGITEDDGRMSRMHVPPVVICECNSVEAIAVLNTASVISTISMEMVEKLRLKEQIIPETRVTNNPILIVQPEVKGRVKYVDLGLGSWQQVGQFYVVDSSTPDISLGVDFLRKTQSIINFEDASLIVGGQKGVRIPFLTTSDVVKFSRKVNLAATRDTRTLSFF